MSIDSKNNFSGEDTNRFYSVTKAIEKILTSPIKMDKIRKFQNNKPKKVTNKKNVADMIASFNKKYFSHLKSISKNSKELLNVQKSKIVIDLKDLCNSANNIKIDEHTFKILKYQNDNSIKTSSNGFNYNYPVNINLLLNYGNKNTLTENEDFPTSDSAKNNNKGYKLVLNNNSNRINFDNICNSELKNNKFDFLKTDIDYDTNICNVNDKKNDINDINDLNVNCLNTKENSTLIKSNAPTFYKNKNKNNNINKNKNSDETRIRNQNRQDKFKKDKYSLFANHEIDEITNIKSLNLPLLPNEFNIKVKRELQKNINDEDKNHPNKVIEKIKNKRNKIKMMNIDKNLNTLISERNSDNLKPKLAIYDNTNIKLSSLEPTKITKENQDSIKKCTNDLKNLNENVIKLYNNSKKTISEICNFHKKKYFKEGSELIGKPIIFDKILDSVREEVNHIIKEENYSFNNLNMKQSQAHTQAQVHFDSFEINNNENNIQTKFKRKVSNIMNEDEWNLDVKHKKNSSSFQSISNNAFENDKKIYNIKKFL